MASLRKCMHLLWAVLLCCLWLAHSTTSVNIPSPYHLESLSTRTIPSDAVIVDSAANSTHIAILDSYFVLRVYSFASSGNITLTKLYDAGPWIPNSSPSWSYSRFTNTAAVALHPQTGEVFIASYYPESNYATLEAWKFTSALTYSYRFNISSPVNYFKQQANNIRINLHPESIYLYIGVYHSNAYTSAATGFFIAKFDWSTYQYTTIESSSNALAIEFACNGVYICVWTSSRSRTKYRMDSLAFVQNQTLGLSATQVNFDPAVRTVDSTGHSVYFQRLFNDSSRYVISILSSQIEPLQSLTLPFIVDFQNIPSYDCRIDSGGIIFAAFSSFMNSSIGLGSTEILVSTINSTSGILSSTIVISTIRQDNVSRVYIPNDISFIVTGTTDGNLLAPSTQPTGRRIFLARFQKISINNIETSTSGRIAKGDIVTISFTSLPSAAITSGVPSVMLQSRPCTTVSWVNATAISAVVPNGIGRSVELFVSFYYLPHTPSVVDFRLSYVDPVITDVTPSQGPAMGFDVTITANNLGIPGTDAVKVTIGEFACVNIIQISSDQITCRVPSGTGIQHRLIVSTEPAAKSSENVFISYDPPRLMAISPSLGAAAGNTIVRLSGQNFGQCPQIPPCSSNISVTIGGKLCSSIVLLNDTNVECRSPANIGKNHSIIIDVGGQTVQNVSALYSYEKPAISLLVPSTASTSNPTIYIEGSNFGISENIPTVQFISENGTYECPSVSWKSDSSIKCDFNNVSLPFDVTFLATVSVGGQLNRENLNATFRAGIINNAPSAEPCSIFMSEDTVSVITLQGSDTDLGDRVRMYVVSAPSNGQLYQFSPTALNSRGQVIDPSLSPVAVSDTLGRVVYIPRAEYSGNDTFNFLARDQYLTESADVTASIIIQEVADYPIPMKDNYRFFEDDQNFITLRALDPDSPVTDIDFYILSLPKGQLLEVVGDLSAVIQTVPYHLVGDRVLYKPPENEFGEFFTSFSFSVSDGTSLRMDLNATVSISIQSVNDIPLAANMLYHPTEDSDYTFSFGCSDVDFNDRSTVVIKGVPPPEAGILYQANQLYRAGLDRNGRIYENDTVIGSAVYVSSKNYFGSFNFTYSCVDSSQAESADATITMNVLNINDPPVARDIFKQIDEDSVAEFLLDPADVESPFETLSVIILDLPLQGLLYIASTPTETNTTWLPIQNVPFGPTASKRLKFIPTTNSFGFSIFHYLTHDGTDISVYNGSVVISVKPINDSPTLILPGNVMEFFEDTEVVIPFMVLDVDEGLPSVKISNIQLNGSLFHVDARSGSKNQLLIGENSEIPGPPYRVLFIPQPNYFTDVDIGQLPQSFEVKLTDFTSSTSISQKFQFNIRPVNDPPELFCENIELPLQQITEATAVHSFTIGTDDPDDQNLTYFLVASTLAIGELLDDSGNTINVNDTFFSANLTFHSNYSGGSYPFPSFTVYVIDKHGASSKPCEFQFTINCSPRTYNNIFNNEFGPICVTCPNGAICSPDGKIPPRPQLGYWQSDKNFTFLPCFPTKACPGNEANSCAAGYEGTRCGQCMKGYYRLGENCLECASTNTIPLILVAICLSVLGPLLLFIYRSRRGGLSFAILNIGINFVQTISINRQLQIVWPPQFYEVLNAISVVNFSIDFASPECHIFERSLNFSARLRLSLVTPLILAGVLASVFTIQYVTTKLYHTLAGSKQLVQDMSVVVSRFRGIMNLLLLFVYTSVTTHSLALFDCTQEGDGQIYLDADRSLRCYENWWYQDLLFAIPSVCFYVVGMPAYFASMSLPTIRHKIFTYCRKSKTISKNVIQYDSSFKTQFQFFVVLQLFQKLMLILISVFLTRYTGLQIVLNLTILLISFQLILKCKPYKIKVLNDLELLSHLSAMAVLAFGLPFYVDSSFEDHTYIYALTVFILVVIFGFIFVLLCVLVYELLRKRRLDEKQTQKGLTTKSVLLSKKSTV